MKIGTWARLLLTGAPLLAGCANFWQAPGSTTTITTTPSTLSSGIFYVANQETMQIVAYDIVSGKLNQINAYPLSAAPYAIAIAPNSSFLYVSTPVGIYLYTVGSGGVLTVGNGGGVISTDVTSTLQVDPSAKWLVDALQGTSGVQLNAIPITSTGAYSGGTVSTVSYSISSAAVHQLAISPDNNNVFVALGAGGTLVVPFTYSNSNPFGSGATTIQVAHSGGSALSVAVDPSNRLFYIGETLANSSSNSGGLRAFNYSSLGSATLTQASGSPLASGGLAPNSILPLASGDYVYVANGAGTGASGNVAEFAITSTGSSTATTYTVTAGSTIAAGIQPSGLAEDNLGNFVLAVSSGGSYDLEAYTMSAGTLTAALTSTTGTDPVQAVAVAALP
jgi:hypothetical protein